MTCLVDDVREKLDITFKTMEILEDTIRTLCGEKHPGDNEKVSPSPNSIFDEMDLLKRNMLCILKDAEALKAMVCGSEVSEAASGRF